jgi:hypothetical protein
MKLCGLVPNFYIHVSVRDLYIPSHERSANAIQKNGQIVAGIFITPKYINVEIGMRPRSFISGNICFEFLVQYSNSFDKYSSMATS